MGEAVTAAGMGKAGPLEDVRSRPWSTVLRAPTDAGIAVYFKAPVPALHHEADVLRLLGRRRPDAVTEVIAHDRARGWMLLRDAGTPIDGLPAAEALAHWERALPEYAQLQLDVAPDAAALRAAIPLDRGTDTLPAWIDRILADEALLRLGRPEGLSPGLYAQLHALAAGIGEPIAALLASPIPDTIQNDDLTSTCVFPSDVGYRFIDWGDACVSFPLFTLTVTLRSIAWQYDLAPGAAELDRLRDAYLEPWEALAPHADLLELDRLARPLGQVCRTVDYYDIVRNGHWNMSDDPDAVAWSLRLVLEPEAWRDATD